MKTLVNLCLLVFSLNSLARAENNIDRILADNLAWEDQELAADISDWTMGSLLVAPYLYAWTGEHKLRNVSSVFVAQSLTWISTDITKRSVKRIRPNGEDDRSFFSGHTSSAFVGASLLCSMKKHCTEALVLAGLTGYLRIAAKKHYFSDVVIGAGVGYAFGRYVPTLILKF